MFVTLDSSSHFASLDRSNFNSVSRYYLVIHTHPLNGPLIIRREKLNEFSYKEERGKEIKCSIMVTIDTRTCCHIMVEPPMKPLNIMIILHYTK